MITFILNYTKVDSTETCWETRAIVLNDYLASPLPTGKVELYQRLQEGYKSKGSLEGYEGEEGDNGNVGLGLNFRHELSS